MSVTGFAPIITTVSATTTTIQNGENIRVYGFILSATGTGQKTFTFANAAGTTIFVVTMEFEAVVSNVPWIADHGLKVTAPANSTAVIFHTHSGT